MLNPYASFLGERNPLDVLETTSSQMESILQKLGPAGVKKSLAPGKWSVREIISHLADCEIAFGFRLRQTLAEDNHVVQPFDQEKWAANYAGYDIQAAMAAFSALRRWNIALIKSTAPEQLVKTVTHPERGTMTFSTIVETMGGHDLNHLQQMEAIAARA